MNFARVNLAIQARAADIEMVALTLLLLATAILYLPVLSFPFLDFDDKLYVTQNQHVKNGLAGDALEWSFTECKYFYHPLTWISLMFDSQIYKGYAGGFHATSLLLHLTTVALVFMTAKQLLPKSEWIAFVVATIFALHPINVETVVWISERKGQLAGAFGIGSILSHVLYSKSQRVDQRYYYLSIFLYACSLLAKPSYVFFPLMFVVFDYCQQRHNKEHPPTSGNTQAKSFTAVANIDYVPFAVIAALATAVNLYAAHSTNSIREASVPTVLHLLAAPFMIIMYHVKGAIWPTYFSPLEIPPRYWGRIDLLMAGVIGFTGAVVAFLALRKKMTTVAFGLSLFLAGLAPTLGFIQIGNHFVASRYAYLPVIGLFITAGALLKHASIFPRTALLLCWLPWQVHSIVTSGRLIELWKSDRTIFEEVVKHEPGNSLAWTNLGAAYSKLHCPLFAEHCFRTSIAVGRDELARIDLALLLGSSCTVEACSLIQPLLETNPDALIALALIGNELLDGAPSSPRLESVIVTLKTVDFQRIKDPIALRAAARFAARQGIPPALAETINNRLQQIDQRTNFAPTK